MKLRDIIEFRFKDLYENEYYQLLHLGYENKKSSVMQLSKVYKGKSYRTQKNIK